MADGLTAAQGDAIIALLQAMPAAIAAALHQPNGSGRKQAGRKVGALKTLSRADREVLESLMPILVSRWDPGNIMTAPDIAAHLAVRPPCVARHALLEIGNPNTVNQRLGLFLGRVVGHDIDGLYIAKSLEVRAGAIWELARSSAAIADHRVTAELLE